MRVIELGTFMSVPFAGRMLADLGAEVIKVEPPGGDPFRRFGRPATPDSAQFVSSNHGKRSIAVDLKAPGVLDRVRRLVAESDVLLCNWRPGVADRVGLGDDDLARDNPRLIRVWVTGFGTDGPSAGEPAYDTIVQGRSGLTLAVTVGDTPLVAAGYPMDKLTAYFVTQAVLAALYSRERSGFGDRIDLAMLDTAAYAAFPDLLARRTFVDHASEDPRSRHALAVGPVPAQDGWMVVAPVSGRDFRAACDAIDRPELADELLAIPDQAELVTTMISRFSSVTRGALLQTWLERFRSRGVPVAPCLDIDEHLADPQTVQNALYHIRDVPGFGSVRSVRYPAIFQSAGRLEPPAPAPRLGAHNSLLEPAGETDTQ